MATPTYRTKYERSRAVIIGVDAYEHTGPLRYAVADARGVQSALVRYCGFDAADICLLTDGDAKKASILDAFLALANDGAGPDDRVVVFFAGHGHTEPSHRGDVGFLVPCDGDPRNLATLIGWEELTRGADLIRAKHVLFVMDACYGGLAVKRGIKPGAMRFLKSMLLRPSRQVITAGKGDEPVGDCGGPIAGHSPFTGHLLQALSGKAADATGVMTAFHVMTYVYKAVALDARASQTPHYGQLDGDGDLVFCAPGILDSAEHEPSTHGEDVLLAMPASPEPPASIIEEAKELLAEERHKLRLFELVASETRRTTALTREDSFPIGAKWSEDEFRTRVGRYEALLRELATVECLLGHWSQPGSNCLTLALKRHSDPLRLASGITVWLSLRWYPCLLLLYAGGLGAVSGGRYANLEELLLAETTNSINESGKREPLMAAIMDGIWKCRESFKLFPVHARHYVPMSEYIFSLLQPWIDDVLFLGMDYEAAFDRFEVLMALEYMHRSMDDGIGALRWGRFGWKFSRGRGDNPYTAVVDEGAAAGADWPPITAGLFGGSTDRFQEVAALGLDQLQRLGWF